MNLSSQRDLFEIPEDIVYLNCAFMAPQLRPAREVGERAVSRKSRPWEITPDAFFEDAEEIRALFARLVGGDADGVAIIPSVSYGISVAAANLDVREGEKMVILEDQFPSNVYAWGELAERSGARLVTLPRPEDFDWTRALLEEIDTTTAVVAVPNCHWTDGSLVDLACVGESAREAGAALVVDAIQSLGAHPFDVSEVRPDFLVASSYKWLLGPYGGRGAATAHRLGSREHLRDHRLVDGPHRSEGRRTWYRDDPQRETGAAHYRGHAKARS